MRPRLPLPPESYDEVVALYSIIHIPLTAQPVLLRAIAGWLVPDGLLVLSAGWRAWTGAQLDWLGRDTPMWLSHADAAAEVVPFAVELCGGGSVISERPRA